MDLGNMQDKAKDMLSNPDTRAKIEQMAKEHNMSLDEAKKRYMDQQSQTGQS